MTKDQNSPKKSSKSQSQTSNKLAQHITGFQKRWNASWDDNTLFVQFKNRLLYLINSHLAHPMILNQARLNRYAYYCGLQAPYSGNSSFFELTLMNEGLQKTIVFSTISDSTSPLHLAWYLQNLFMVLSEIPQAEIGPAAQLGLSSFQVEFEDLLKASPSIQLRISKTKKGMLVYPAGAKLLDEGLVNDNLNWLQDYPESLRAFEQALSIYLGGDKPKYRNLIDNLRVAIEQLLRRILNNQKSLEKQTKELDNWLAARGVHKQIRNLYGQFLFGPYTVLQNDVAKHGDEELLADEIEYVTYLTGAFIRLVVQLKRSET
jgi:hypothetical protein